MLGKLGQRIAEHRGERGQLGCGSHRLPGFGREQADAVVQSRVFLRRAVALALLGAHMQQHRAVLDSGGHFQMAAQTRDVVPVHRADVVEAKRLKQHARRKERFEAPFTAHGVYCQLLADARNGAQEVEHFLAGLAHPALRQRTAQKQRKRANIGRNGHFIVVEHHNEPPPHVPGKIQALKGLARRQRTVADHGQHMVPEAGKIAGQSHAQCRRNGRGGMPHAKMVVRAFCHAREAGNAAKRP